ncbi:MAG: hypothetical protein BMS9Abin01_0883 [Gammaproteobacteria bacterium]|nr:MAG: hypothetical protein BMS9Abin01_0883 [Gammaproteobacteria bacterium]
MDDSVMGAMARWPNVPAVYGWLSLDRRGRWCLQGEPVFHRGVIDFMNRNYDCTADGEWYFQNGPQRAFVDLDYTPWIYSLDGSRNLVDHAGSTVSKLHGVWLDEEGNLLLLGERGIGLLCDRDLAPMSEYLRLCDGAAGDQDSIARLIQAPITAKRDRVYLAWNDERFEVKTLLRNQVAGEFGFDPMPRARDDGG